MPNFKQYFGIEASEIKKTCVIAPFLTRDLTKDLGIDSLIKGKPYSTGQTPNFTFIYSQMGGPMVGDCVLHLKESSCEYLILIGACGSLKKQKDLKIGSLVAPQGSYCLESFSTLLNKEYQDPQMTNADPSYFETFRHYARLKEVKQVACATVGSIKLEKDYYEYFIDKGIDVVDMECSSFFNAARHIGRRALALFYVTDIISEESLFTALNPTDQTAIKDGQKELARHILQFAGTEC